MSDPLALPTRSTAGVHVTVGGTVTGLREHPRKPGRYALELDGARLGVVSLETVAGLGLRVGTVVDAGVRSRLDAAVRVTECYDRAVGALARRARSRAELVRWLRAREFTAEEIGSVVEKLSRLGLVDDVAFARGFARGRLGPGKAFGPRRVAAELARRGVDRRVIDAVLAELAADGEGDELTAIRDAAAKKRQGMRGLDALAARRRLYGYLSRRGFGGEAIRAVMRETEF